MDNVPARVSYIDRDYRYRFLNRHNEEWLGAEPQRADRPAASPKSSATSALRASSQPLLDRVLNGEVVSTELMLPQPDGELQWEAIHYAPQPRQPRATSSASTRCTPTSTTRSSNEDALRRANWMLSSHISNTPLAVLEWDRDFRLVRWSPQAENIFGWDGDEVLGMPISRQPAAARGRQRGDGRR